MNKKTKTTRPNTNVNNGMQLTNHFLDERAEQMLTPSSLANPTAGCSSIFRHAGSLFQINKNEFHEARDADVNQISNFSSPLNMERDILQPQMSPHVEVIKEGLYRPSSPISPDDDARHHSDRHLKDFTTSPAHLLTSSLSFPLATSHQHFDSLRRSKVIHNCITSTCSTTEGFNIIPSLVAGSNHMRSVDDVRQFAEQMQQDNVKKEPTYRPQVEAVSPTCPGEEMSPSEAIRHSKDEILQNINRLDRLITNVDQRINKLRRLKEPLEEKSQSFGQPPEENVARPTPAIDLSRLGVAHSVYSENRLKAIESHQFMKVSGFELCLPLYQKPSDAHIYHDNIKKFLSFKQNLIIYIKKRKQFEAKRDTHLCKRYDRLSQAWVERMDRSENNTKKRIKDGKTREVFEKIFPELKRKREEKERLAKIVKKSDTDFAVDPEEAEVRMRMGMTAEPPMMLNPLARKKRFLNENGHIHDNFELGQLLPGIKKFYWTKSECDIFRETYVVHPKNFGRISSQLQNKSIQDCIYFYYVTKKEEGYKLLVRRHNMSRRKHDKAKKAHKEVKEEKIEEQKESKDLKFLPSSPVVASSSCFSTYQFKLPQYLLIPSYKMTSPPNFSPTSSPHIKCSPPSSPIKCSPPPSPTNYKPSSTAHYLGMIKQEPKSFFPPSSSSSSPLLLSSSTTSTYSSVLPICTQIPASDAIHTEILGILPVSSTSLLAATPTSPNQILTSNNTKTITSSHQQMQCMLPLPPHAGGSIVQGTPVVVSHPNELNTMWQQIQLQLLMQQQQFHQRQQDQHASAQFNATNLPIPNHDIKTLVHQIVENQHETRGSIIKGTPNHIVRDPAITSNSHVSPILTTNRLKQDRISPSNNSPKRLPSGRTKVPSRNETNPIREIGEENNRLFEHSRDILIDDFMTAQKMNTQQKMFPNFNNNSDQIPSKKHNSVKRKFGPPSTSDGLLYFAGMEVPKGSLPHPGNETARSLIDNIISQNIVKTNEDDRLHLKSSDVARPMTPSRVNPNFQSPASHFFPTSCGPTVPGSLQPPTMMLQSLIPPFFASGLPLLQGPFPPLFPSNTIIGPSEKAASSVVRMDRPNFASPPLQSGLVRSSTQGASNSYPLRIDGGKTTPRSASNNIYNFISSSAYGMQVQSPSSSSFNPAFAQLPPAMISHPSSSSGMLPLPSSTSPGFHPPASFLQMFPLGQFMSSFPLQMPQQGVTPSLTSRPPSSLFMSQLIQNFHQQLSEGGMMTAVAAAAPKSTSGHV